MVSWLPIVGVLKFFFAIKAECETRLIHNKPSTRDYVLIFSKLFGIPCLRYFSNQLHYTHIPVAGSAVVTVSGIFSILLF